MALQTGATLRARRRADGRRRRQPEHLGIAKDCRERPVGADDFAACRRLARAVRRYWDAGSMSARLYNGTGIRLLSLLDLLNV